MAYIYTQVQKVDNINYVLQIILLWNCRAHIIKLEGLFKIDAPQTILRRFVTILFVKPY